MLAGDYLLARASVLLAKLDNVDVVQIMASALDALVQGEIMQIKSAPNDMLEMSSEKLSPRPLHSERKLFEPRLNQLFSG